VRYQPLVSVVIPTRDRPDELRQAVKSVIAQDVDLEIVVVDNGRHVFADGLPGAVDDQQIRYVRTHTAGASHARNIGIAAARGLFIAFCDDDDLWAPDHLSALLDATVTSNARWAFGGEVHVDDRLRVIGHGRADPLTFDSIRWSNTVRGGGSGVLVERDLLTEVGGFDETLTHCEDWDLWIRLARESTPAVVDRPLVAYRVWAKAKSLDDGAVATSVAEIRRRHGMTATGPDATALHLARQCVRAERRAAAARRFLDLGIREHRPSHALRALASLIAPRVFGSIGRRRARRRVPAPWVREVTPWLDALAHR
jgi:GT2 family glycosyltransferase